MAERADAVRSARQHHGEVVTVLGHQFECQGARGLVVWHDVARGSVQLGEEGVARRGVVVVGARHRLHGDGLEPQAEPGARRGGGAHVVRLQGTERDDAALSARDRRAQQELELAHLVATESEAAEVLPLHPQSVDVVQGSGPHAEVGARAIAQVHGSERATPATDRDWGRMERWAPIATPVSSCAPRSWARPTASSRCSPAVAES
nr:hypothetical protein [Aeromicrobium phoceense]